ncbi:MAG: aldehyde dehydrogenase family protein [Planctomycetota bacterium]
MRPLYLAGRPHMTGRGLTVRDKATGDVIEEVALADSALVRDAIAAADGARESMRRLAPHRRAEALDRARRHLEERRDELVESLVREAGKPLTFARGEHGRMLDTFRLSALEATRASGESVPLGASASGDGYRAQWKRVPIGVCGFITPFNFPLNLVAHKVAPAIAAGCPFVLKPASSTPIGALMIGEALAAAGLPDGAFSILPAKAGDAAPIVEDDRVRKLSFTGSDEVGWDLKARAGKKRVTLELGGNAAVIVDETCDLDEAARRIVYGAFYQSGQSCISVQRVIAVDAIYDELRRRLVDATRAVAAGDPHSEETLVGPLISEGDAERVAAWVTEACDAGARCLVGGERDGAVVQPTLLEDVPEGAKVLDEEVFGPVAALVRVRDFEDALREANRTRFGLQAGVFTRDLHRAHRAWDEIEVGGVVVGDVPAWRADAMPYGGVKDSGIGREGPAFAIEEMTELRLLVVRDAPHDQ